MARGIQRAPIEVKQAIIERVSELAKTGAAMKDVAVVLQKENPEYSIDFNTVKNLALRNGIGFHASTAPKVKVPTQEELTELVAMERQNQDLRARLQLAERKYKEVQRDETTAERLIAEALPLITSLRPVEPQPHNLVSKDSHSPQDAVCQISCLHNGEVVSRAATDGHGWFDQYYAAARLQYFVDTVLDLTFNHHQGERIDTLWVVDIGDNGSGAIHDELKATNVFPFGEQLVRTAHLLAFAVRDLATHFRRVVFVGTVGNHMRFEKKPPSKDKVRNNGDWVIYQHMQALLADQKNVEFIIPDAPWANLDIQGHRCFFAHGDGIRMYMQFPWYDTSRFVSQMGQLIVSKTGLEAYPEYWGFGHFHQANSTQLSYGRWLFTGSAKGPDEFSINRLRAGTPATWLYYGMHERRGRSFYYEVDMMSAEPDVQDRYLSAVS